MKYQSFQKSCSNFLICYINLGFVLRLTYCYFYLKKFLDAGIQDVSTSIKIVHDLIERYRDDDDGDESNKHIWKVGVQVVKFWIQLGLLRAKQLPNIDHFKRIQIHLLTKVILWLKGGENTQGHLIPLVRLTLD